MGNKLRHLIKLKEMGMDVPPFRTNKDMKDIQGVFSPDPIENMRFSLGKYFGTDAIISVRSSGEKSMPGVLKTVTDVSLGSTKEFADAYMKVLNSYTSPLARAYMKRNGIEEESEPTIIFQRMVHGKSVVHFTRDPLTGKKSVTLVAERDNVVAGYDAEKIASDVLFEIGDELEKEFGYPQDIEAVIDGETVWVLQTRDIIFDRRGIYKAHADIIRSGIASREEIAKRTPVPHPRDWHEVCEGTEIGQGTGCSSGIFTGPVCIDGKAPEGDFIYISDKMDVDENINFDNCKAVVSRMGNILCHAATLARKKGIPCIHLPDGAFTRGTIYTVDGYTGKIYLGEVKTRVHIHINQWLEVIYDGHQNNIHL